MKRGCDEKSQRTSPSRTRLGHGVDIHIPLDITVEILKKLPTKSLVRFQCVSKLWSSIISSCRDFIDSIVTRSLSQLQPDAHLIYHYVSGTWFLASLSNTGQELVLVPGEYHEVNQFVRGLICSWSINRHTHKVALAIYNPTTRQSIYLPNLNSNNGDFLFGYDPLENQYKVVFLPKYGTNKSFRIFTLGDPRANSWRIVQGDVRPWACFLLSNVVCINGTIYCRQVPVNGENDLLMSFDVRSEKFFHVDAPKKTEIDYHYFPINYLGKLGYISCEKGVEIWVMETQGWSKIFCWEMDGFKDQLLISGATHSGEIVFRDCCYRYVGDPMLRIYYYDPKRICMRCVVLKDYYHKEKGSHNIRLSGNFISVIWTVPDYVENTMRLKLTI